MLRGISLLGVCLLLVPSYSHGDEPAAETQLADQAYSILKLRCYRCHGGSAQQAGLDVLSRASLLEERGNLGHSFVFVAPGEVAHSQLVDSIEGGEDSYMPQSGSPEAEEVTNEEKEVLKQWVIAGAPFPKRRSVNFISDKQILSAVREYLLRARADDRRYLRFYSFAHLQNNEGVSERDLRLYRAALSKAINSLSKERDVYLPQPLPGMNYTLYVIDLRKLGWDKGNLWGEILKQYPYGLKYDYVKDEEFQQIAKDVALFAGGNVPVLRADWFVVAATQPPLYHALLDIPDTLMKLEHQLQLNIQQNFKHNKLQRSGYAKSGVSRQNRLLERHTSPGTAYFWISYDFLPRRAKGDVIRFPLGPVFPGNQFHNQAFEHDGGEIIWSLPNGLQAYMLVNAKGNRINAGPVEVVFDRSALLGTPAIINGISCMYCHRAGMITEFRDEIRLADTLGGDARQKVQKLHPPHEEMQRLVQQDQQKFLRALERTIGPYLKVGDDEQMAVTEFPEPIGKVAEMYARDLTPREVALELGYEKVGVLQSKIEANRELLRYGLGTIVQEPPGTLKREKWETRDGTSLMQDVASQLRLGTPVIP